MVWYRNCCADNISSKLDSVEQSTFILEDFDVIEIDDLEVREEGDDFEFINLPDSNEMNSLPYYEAYESVIEIARFNREKLLQMCTFSKMAYGNNDTKLSEAGYKIKAEFFNESYSIIPFYYSDGRHAGVVFTKGEEVTILMKR